MNMVYKCKNCGGNTVYHPDKRSMYCPYCDGIDSEKEVTGTSAANCINCGAPLEVGEFISACRCQHCGSYIIMDERVENEYEPHMIIPFKVSKEKAVELLKSDNVVGMPTETVYGLAGNAYSEKAVKRIFEAKGRPQDNPLIVHIADVSQLEDYVYDVPEIAYKLAKKFCGVKYLKNGTSRKGNRPEGGGPFAKR